MKFGDYLRIKREEREWTQPQAADRIGIEQSYLSKLETGKSYPSEDIFDRLKETYAINTDEMSERVESAELVKLKDIKSVRFAVLGQHQRRVTHSRKWMVSGLVCLVVGGAMLGTAIVPDSVERKYHYRSEGILLPNEALNAFDEIRSQDQSRREVMLRRLDQDDQTFADYRGDSFIESTAEGRRYYELYGARETSGHSHRRLFIIPAFALLFGCIGCFLIGFRWRQW